MEWAPNFFSGVFDGVKNFFGGSAGTSPTPPVYTPKYSDTWEADPTYKYWSNASDEEKDTIISARNFGVDQNDNNVLDTLFKYGFDSSGQHAQEFMEKKKAREAQSKQAQQPVQPAQAQQPQQPQQPQQEARTPITSADKSVDQNFWAVNDAAQKIMEKYRPQYDAAIKRIVEAKNPYDTNSPEFRKILSGATDRVASQMGRAQAAIDPSMAARGSLGGTLRDVTQFGHQMASRKAQAGMEDQLYRDAFNKYTDFENQRTRDYTNLIGAGMSAEMQGLQALSSTTKDAVTQGHLVRGLELNNMMNQITVEDLQATQEKRQTQMNKELQYSIDSLVAKTMAGYPAAEVKAAKIALEVAAAKGLLDKGQVEQWLNLPPWMVTAGIFGSEVFKSVAKGFGEGVGQGLTGGK